MNDLTVVALAELLRGVEHGLAFSDPERMRVSVQIGEGDNARLVPAKLARLNTVQTILNPRMARSAHLIIVVGEDVT